LPQEGKRRKKKGEEEISRKNKNKKEFQDMV
jgi:hypothetical protein